MTELRRPEFASFREFWPYYLGEHRDQRNRSLHYAGTSLVICLVVGSAVTLHPMGLLAAPVFGYGPAWAGHFLIEKNRPATFKHPFYSLIGDFWMLWCALRGKISSELARLEVTAAK